MKKIQQVGQENKKTMFEKLYGVNVCDHTEKKNGLSYLSWAFAWAETKKIYPNATYEIKTFGENNLPYVHDQNTGYMVFTSMTIEELTHDMWLPVMDGANKAMKSEPYTYDTKWKKDVSVEVATMFDINKTIMRCLVKNIAMFGLGLYIYAGEDLPESVDEQKLEPIIVPDSASGDSKRIISMISQKYPTNCDKLINNICKKYNVTNFFELTDDQLKEVEEKL